TEKSNYKEKMKMTNDTKKVMEQNDVPVAATSIRLPVFTSQAERVYIEVEKDGVSAEELKETLKNGKGIVLEDDITTQTYPTPLSAEYKKEVYVGRVRKDPDTHKGYNWWDVSDTRLTRTAR